MMTLFAKDGTAKLVSRCTYPLTGVGCVSRVYTDLGTFLVGGDGVEGVAVAETFGVSVNDLQARMDVPLRRLDRV
jgi:3-oxoadipate CoA-transferase beta subunit